MGPNDSLPPPPPDPHHIPPPPPPTPAPPPPAPQVPTLPPAQPYQPPAPAAAPYQQQPYQAYQQPPMAPPAPPAKNRRPLFALVGVVAVAAIAVGIALATKKDTKAPATLGGDTTVKVTTTAVSSITTAAPGTTTGGTNGTTAPTLVITLPPTTAGSGGSDTTTGSSTSNTPFRVADDTSTFTVTMPGEFKTATAPLTANGVKFPHVSGSQDMKKYVSDDDTFGISVLAATTAQVPDAATFATLIGPSSGACSSTKTDSYSTGLGDAVEVRYDGCGTGGKFSKVVLSIAIPGKNIVMLAICQGPAPSTGSLRDFTVAIFNTITLN